MYICINKTYSVSQVVPMVKIPPANAGDISHKYNT